MQKTRGFAIPIIIAVVAILAIGGVIYLAPEKRVVEAPVVEDPDLIACTMDAFMCPDGSYVGRSGPKCEFVCPAPAVKGNEARIGGTVIIDGVKITPLEVIEDSRCAVDTTCVWAGTVKIKAKIERDGQVEEKVLTLSAVEQPMRAGNANVLFKDVKPVKISGQTIKNSDYIFSFSLIGMAY